MKLKNINKKAEISSVFNIFTFMIVAFLVVVFYAGLIYVMGLINGIFHDVGVANEVNIGQPTYVNMTLASEQTFGQINDGIKSLRLVALVYILSLAVVIMLTNSLQRIHPIFFFAYILICLLAVIFAPQISNAYETLLSSGIFEGELNNFSVSNLLILNLPIVVLIISVFGGVFLFINLIRTQEVTQLQ